ncbi:carboxypeptidase Y-deficient [Microbotryomycetes sp. JL221]|nr:carboxypeptidase Y-deficient [Microbotryomycetes sp. JL221]
MPPHAVIVGAGVVGLSTALQLQNRGYEVTIIAEHMPGDPKTIKYTSPWAGAHHVSVATGADMRMHNFDKDTFEHMSRLIKEDPTVPLNFLRQVEYREDPRPHGSTDQVSLFERIYPDFRRLEQHELVPGTKFGASFTCIQIDTPNYLTWLRAKFERNGGTLHRARLLSLSHLMSAVPSLQKPDVIVNCSGLGANALVQDESVFPTRGQLVIVRAPWIKEGRTRLGKGVYTYTIPRKSGEVVLGGSADPHNTDSKPWPWLTEQIKRRCLELQPELLPPDKRENGTIDDLDVIELACGLRPTRKGGLRIEIEAQASDVPIVHCYGHGGYGYQTSWATASVAADLLLVKNLDSISSCRPHELPPCSSTAPSSGMSATTGGTGNYVPYTKSKRASTASMSGKVVIPASSSSSSLNAHGAAAAHAAPQSPTQRMQRTTNSQIHSPRPEKPQLNPTPNHFANQSVLNSSPSSSPNLARSPPPASTSSTSWQSHHQTPGSSSGAGTPLPFQNVSPGTSPFTIARRGPSPVKQVNPAQRGFSDLGTTEARTRNDQNGRSPEKRGKAPYHPSFQAQGVKRDRTDEFMARRKSKGESKKLEEGRLGRRLEKAGPSSENKSTTSTLASLAAFGENLRGKTAKELWSSVANSKSEIERAEQRIVNWQEDAEVTRCPICSAAFGLKTRRHHCRLCGRVVCFLPPTPLSPQPTTLAAETRPVPGSVRRERCSTFFTVEYQSKSSGEKPPVGVVSEVEPAEQEPAFASAFDKTPARPKDERKKVRICRDCLNTVLRQQMRDLPSRTPTWLKLYEVLVQLEKEIDDVLPEFQELVLGLQKPASVSTHSRPSAAAAEVMRKRLLTSLASYDTISRRVRDLPLSEGSMPGGSQDRLQRAIAARGSMFLSDKLALLRSLGDLEGSVNKKPISSASQMQQQQPRVQSLAALLAPGESPDTAAINEKVGAELEASAKLNVLLEQEALVRSYVEDANARRQFEDAASLKASLDELQAEIRAIKATLA